MKKYSIWSSRHPVQARMIIALCHIVLVILGITLGIVTYFEEVRISNRFSLFMVLVFSLAYILYPKRKVKEGVYKYSWARRIKHDFLMALSSSCILIAGINQYAFNPLSQPVPQYQVRLMAAKPGIVPVVFSKKEARKDLKTQVRSMKAEIKQQLKGMKAEWKENKTGQNVLKILLILFAIGIALFAWYWIAALSCNLSCNGQEGAAVGVAVLGTLGIILLLIVSIRAIGRMGTTPPAPQIEITENKMDRA
jgi:hypothetical protein